MRPLRYAAPFALALGLLAGCGIIDDIADRVKGGPVRLPEATKYYEAPDEFLWFVPHTHDIIARYRFRAVRWITEERAGDILHVLRGDSIEWDPEITSGYRMDISPDGALLARVDTDSVVELRSADDGLLLRSLIHPGERMRSAAFSPDGQHLVTTGIRIVSIWRANDGTLLRRFDAHDDAIWDVAFAPDGDWFVTASHDTTMKIWSFPDGRLVRTLREGTDHYYRVAVTSDGRFLISGGALLGLRVWDVASGQPIQTLAPGPVWKLAMSTDGSRLVTIGHRQDGLGQVRVWDVPARRMVTMIDSVWAPHPEPAISDDNLYVALGIGARKHHLRILRLSDGQEVDRVYLEGPWPPVWRAAPSIVPR